MLQTRDFIHVCLYGMRGLALWLQDLPSLVHEVFSDSEDGDDADDRDFFVFPPGMTELVCKLHPLFPMLGPVCCLPLIVCSPPILQFSKRTGMLRCCCDGTGTASGPVLRVADIAVRGGVRIPLPLEPVFRYPVQGYPLQVQRSGPSFK